uniref:Uncharacterized protein n=1 Tax=virus sp. ctx9V1 TaxID=2828001 RepID=A0A8S5RDC5_9VIRU|nr:MAG TPA: hypothetical protein [virus sp. ctx9V1]
MLSISGIQRSLKLFCVPGLIVLFNTYFQLEPSDLL